MGESCLSARVYQLVLLQNDFNDHKHRSKNVGARTTGHLSAIALRSFVYVDAPAMTLDLLASPLPPPSARARRVASSYSRGASICADSDD